MLAIAPIASAASLTWDPLTTSSATSGGDGVWSSTQANWFNPLSGSDVTWPGAAQSAEFGGSAGTVDVKSSVSVLGLNFTTAGYTLGGTGSVTIGAGGLATTSGTTVLNTAVVLAAAQSWAVNGALTVGGSISGSQPLAVSGLMTVGDGTTNGSLGATPVALSDGAQLFLNRSDTVTYSGLLSATGSGKLTHSGSGVLNLTAGTAATPSAPGQFFVTGGGTANVSGYLNTSLGAGNRFSVSSGTVNWDAVGTENVLYFGVGDSNGSSTAVSGTFNLRSGQIDVAAGVMYVGSSAGSGLVQVSGGTFNLTSGAVYLGAGASKTFGSNGGTLTITAGTFTTGNSPGAFQLGPDTPTKGTAIGTGTVNLNGGTLATARAITRGTSADGGAVLNFNGGTLQASGSGLSIGGGVALNVLAGAVVDTNGNSVTITPALNHAGSSTDGGLTKNGTGTLTLAGSGTYTGATTLSAGVLRANGAQIVSGGAIVASSTGTGTVQVGNGATLAGTGGTGPVVINNGGKITAGSGATAGNTVGTLTTGDESWNSGGALVTKFAKTAGVLSWDQLHMGTLNLSTVSAGGFKISIVNVSSAFPVTTAATYTLATVSGYTLPGGFGSGKDLTSLFTLDSSGLLAAGTYSIQRGGSGSAQTLDLLINGGAQTAPEPASVLLVVLGASPVLTRRRRIT